MIDTLLAQSSSDSTTTIEVVVWIVLVVGAVIGGYFAHRHRKKKIAQYRAWAAQYGFHYEPKDNSVVDISSKAPFGVGRNRRGQDVFRGSYRGLHILFFEYIYTTGSGKNSTTHVNQVVAIGLPSPRPFLDIGHETTMSRFFNSLGFASLQFENQHFNDVFKVTAENPRFAYDVIHAQTMEWMLADQRARTFSWRFDGPWLMNVKKGKLKLEEVFFYADFLCDIYAQVPKFVWSNN
ncbi:hypothetical protein [Natronoglycomyces albus]|uniref:Uncharacterized protein n=1 Tax=Natronoglycomyces albus TaxID=2811108 RepID=A0A895XS31_9ACTN|nr:hypothetical protein [Natronoglycomyces albus]QSB06139.1 hypothetical protein JQS30_04260 [Natronoglycomyces albus]